MLFKAASLRESQPLDPLATVLIVPPFGGIFGNAGVRMLPNLYKTSLRG
jgi:hypothetical protein